MSGVPSSSPSIIVVPYPPTISPGQSVVPYPPTISPGQSVEEFITGIFLPYDTSGGQPGLGSTHVADLRAATDRKTALAVDEKEGSGEKGCSGEKGFSGEKSMLVQVQLSVMHVCNTGGGSLRRVPCHKA